MGAEAKLKAEVAGGKEGKPPTGCGITPPRPSAARVQPQGTCMARSVSAAGGLMPGMQGAKPLA